MKEPAKYCDCDPTSDCADEKAGLCDCDAGRACCKKAKPETPAPEIPQGAVLCPAFMKEPAKYCDCDPTSDCADKKAGLCDCDAGRACCKKAEIPAKKPRTAAWPIPEGSVLCPAFKDDPYQYCDCNASRDCADEKAGLCDCDAGRACCKAAKPEIPK